MGTIDLVPIYLADRRRLLDGLSGRVERILEARVRLRPPTFDPEECFDAERGQYHSTRMLRHLLDALEPGTGRVVGVTSVDLFIPILTFVFGEAQVNGRAAVVSLHRLRPEAYGLPADDGLLAHRLAKETLHELGHTHGLLHCPEPDCVMRSSTYVEEIDLKPARFCGECGSVLRGSAPPIACADQ